MDVLLGTPPPLETSRTFFDIYLADFKIECQSIKVHLGQSQQLIMSIHIYLKCKYTYENAGFCILCVDNFKILKLLPNHGNFPQLFNEKRHRRQPPPPPPNVHMTFLRSWTKSICDASLIQLKTAAYLRYGHNMFATKFFFHLTHKPSL